MKKITYLIISITFLIFINACTGYKPIYTTNLQFKIADLVKDTNILEYSRNVAITLLEDDEMLEKEENKNILKAYLPYAQKRTHWSRIS